MKKSKLSRAVVGILLIFLLVIAAAVLFSRYIIPAWLNHKRISSGPPSILVVAPRAGDSVSPGGSMLAQATVTGTSPIANVELWLDGERIFMQTPDPNQTTVYTVFTVELDAGTHMLYWRAVDIKGLVGQSVPIPIAGEFPPGTGGTITVNAGNDQSLEDMADAQGIDPGVLQNLNPNFGEGNLPAGTNVTVPAPSGSGGSRQQSPNNAPTSPLPNPPVGIAALLPVTNPTFDFSSLIPGLVSSFPASPSYLQAGFENCKVRLVWNDNATNENSFKVWMQALGGPPLLIQTLHDRLGTGQTWFEFESPSFGIYSFWVESVNALGTQSSEIAWVAVNDTNCGEGVASQLEIEALSMYGFGGGWDQIYCYLSIEGAPEKRVPEGDGQFLQKDILGGADIHKWIGGKNRILIKMPGDEEVSLEGDCWGWLGDNPASMGTFGVSVPREHWDNRTLQARSDNYVIDFRIRPFGSSEVHGAYQYVDYDIPPPYNLVIVVREGNDPVQNAYWAQHPIIKWDWDGSFGDITGFKLYVNGSVQDWNVVTGFVTAWDPALGRQALSPTLPTTCGGTYQFQVVANSGQAQSRFSESKEYRQPPCQRYLEVTFESFSFSHFDDGESGTCDDPELELDLAEVKNIAVGEMDLECNKEYFFSGLPGSYQILPIEPNASIYRIWVYFIDHDYFVIDWGPQNICALARDIPLGNMSDSEWNSFEMKFDDPCPFNVTTTGTFYGKGQIKYKVKGILSPQ